MNKPAACNTRLTMKIKAITTPEEIWKEIDGTNGRYEVSNKGRVRSTDYIQKVESKRQKNHLRRHKGVILKPNTDKDGYHLVHIVGKGTQKVHRLVAMAFCPGYKPELTVNHIDENKTNNCAENLEWCTIEENNRHGTHRERAGIKHRKPVVSFDRAGNECDFNSLLEAEITLGIKGASTMISRCCKGKIKSAYGFKWRYKSNYNKAI